MLIGIEQASPPQSPPPSVDPPSSAEPSSNETSNASPIELEKIKSDKQSEEIFPANSSKVPEPEGITAPVKENAKTVLPLDERVNPFAAASPPLAPDTHPSWVN